MHYATSMIVWNITRFMSIILFMYYTKEMMSEGFFFFCLWQQFYNIQSDQAYHHNQIDIWKIKCKKELFCSNVTARGTLGIQYTFPIQLPSYSHPYVHLFPDYFYGADQSLHKLTDCSFSKPEIESELKPQLVRIWTGSDSRTGLPFSSVPTNNILKIQYLSTYIGVSSIAPKEITC